MAWHQCFARFAIKGHQRFTWIASKLGKITDKVSDV